MITQKVVLFAGDGHAIFDVNSGERLNYPYSETIIPGSNEIILKNHVWVGMNASILNGTIIGSGSVVGTNAVLKGTYPNNCCMAGNPGKVVRRDIAWSRNIMDLDINLCGEDYIQTTKISEEEIDESHFSDPDKTE